ncbi:MAG: periplasmic chaperone [Syntrophus sp. PtaU1.Bin208]|nr:MAG: periplasmic chaperone [Syntrophus sp. PtaU1.Bin208]
MKRYGLILTMSLLFLLSLVCPSFAAQDGNAPSLKIAVVDLQKVMQTAKAAKDAQVAFDKELQAARDTLSAKGKEVQTLEEELKKQSAKLSAKKRKEKEEQIAKATRGLKRLDSDMGEEFRRKVSEINQKLIGEIREAVNEIRQEEKCSLVLEKSNLISYDQTLDITDRVIQRYDAKKK